MVWPWTSELFGSPEMWKWPKASTRVAEATIPSVSPSPKDVSASRCIPVAGEPENSKKTSPSATRVSECSAKLVVWPPPLEITTGLPSAAVRELLRVRSEPSCQAGLIDVKRGWMGWSYRPALRESSALVSAGRAMTM